MKIFSRGTYTLPGTEHLVNLYESDTDCTILIGKEGTPHRRWHLSISCKDRDPSWYEIKQARYDLLPRDRDFAMILPKPENFVNIHEHCFHLWEIATGEMLEAIDTY